MRFKKNRLRLTRDVQRVLEQGKTKRVSSEKSGGSTELFLLKYYPYQYTRFTVIVSKKVAKKSVWRNRIKRIVREAIRQLIKEGKAPNFDIVILVRQNIYRMKSYEIKEILEKVFDKLKGNFVAKEKIDEMSTEMDEMSAKGESK